MLYYQIKFQYYSKWRYRFFTTNCGDFIHQIVKPWNHLRIYGERAWVLVYGEIVLNFFLFLEIPIYSIIKKWKKLSFTIKKRRTFTVSDLFQKSTTLTWISTPNSISHSLLSLSITLSHSLSLSLTRSLALSLSRSLSLSHSHKYDYNATPCWWRELFRRVHQWT